jgi:hypothetical protein
VGIVLGFANFVLDAPLGACASLATCAVVLMIGGLAPWPVTATIASARVAAPARAGAPDRRERADATIPAAA